MTLSVDSLAKSGGFCGAPVRREITWSVNGEERTDVVFIRRLSYHSMMSDLSAYQSKQEGAATRIAACVCDESGKSIFTVHDITGIDKDGNPIAVDGVERGALSDSLTVALLSAITEVNGLGKPKQS